MRCTAAISCCLVHGAKLVNRKSYSNVFAIFRINHYFCTLKHYVYSKNKVKT